VSPRIEAVLFDYGGVFTSSPFHAASQLGRDLGTDPRKLVEIVFGPHRADTDHPWHRLERGELTLVEAREQILELGRGHGIEADPFRVLAAMGSDGAGVRDSMTVCARDLKAEGYRTALVTNNAVEFREHWSRSVPLDELFDAVIDSSEVGLRKPDPAIFHLTLERTPRAAFRPGRSVALGLLGAVPIAQAAELVLDAPLADLPAVVRAREARVELLEDAGQERLLVRGQGLDLRLELGPLGRVDLHVRVAAAEDVLVGVPIDVHQLPPLHRQVVELRGHTYRLGRDLRLFGAGRPAGEGHQQDAGSETHEYLVAHSISPPSSPRRTARGHRTLTPPIRHLF
jgi:epoxide hydrolase-like predicted phosphatase